MDTNYTVIDNFLSKDDFEDIKFALTATNVTPWFLGNEIANMQDLSNLFYLTHKIYDNDTITSEYYNNIMIPILQKIEYRSLIRIKCNLYPRTERIIEHNAHTDYPFDHLGALFFVNTNDGYTTLEDGTKIESLENRMLFFNPSLQHYSSTCSDQKYRITINFNYF